MGLGFWNRKPIDLGDETLEIGQGFAISRDGDGIWESMQELG